MSPVTQIDFFIGIVFWCVGQTCGLATHTTSFPDRAHCLQEVKNMERQLKEDKNLKATIVESRCSPQSIQIRVGPKEPDVPQFRPREI